jgi:hypothetical protein
MSPTKRPSSVDGLRRAVAPAPLVTQPSVPIEDEPKARVTLNLPAPMYRDIERWTTTAAEGLGVPRVSIQDALRAMIYASLKDPSARAAALTCLRDRTERTQP